jgi:hypothetical protein
MKTNQNIKIILISYIFTLFVSLLNASGASCDDTKIQAENYNDSLILGNKLPAPRALIPHSLQERIVQKKANLPQQKSSNLECNVTVLCTSFDSNITPENVSSWMGFEVKDSTGKYFIATYGQEATALGNNVYSTPKWNKKHFWMHLGKDIVPFPIQPRFVGIDKESGNEWHTVDYVGYRLKNANIDYANYWENMSQSALILLINPQTKKVLEYYLEYYDENDEYVGDYDIEVVD